MSLWRPSTSVSQNGTVTTLTRAQLPTAFSSPRLPHFAKCALKLAFELPAATPQSALSTLEKLKSTTLGSLGSAGERQSKTIAVSLNTSAASRYILHSGSREVPSLCANRMVAMRPILSCKTERRSAAVGEADASPTPTPIVRRYLYQQLDRTRGT